MAVKYLLKLIALFSFLILVLSAPAFADSTSAPSFNELRVLFTQAESLAQS